MLTVFLKRTLTVCMVVCFLHPVAAQSEPWPRFVIDDTLRGADGVRLADANGDGLVDIVTGWEESGETRAYFHPGAAEVTAAWPRVTVGPAPSIEDAVWVDANADGQLDVLSSCEGREKSLRLHLADSSLSLLDPESWSTRVIDCSNGVTRWMFATPFPPSAKQSPIIAVGSKDPHGLVGLLQYSSSTRSWQITRLADAHWIMSLDVVDVDGDQDLDLLYSDRKGDQSGIYWLENPGEDFQADPTSRPVNAWVRHLIGASGSEVMFLDALVHGSDKSDPQETHRLGELWAAVKPNHVCHFAAPKDVRRQWQQTIIEITPADRIGTAKAVAAADLDADGQVELVFSCEAAVPPKSGVVYLKQDSQNGTWNLNDVSGPEGIKFDLVELVDLDLDGDLDILTCEERHAGRGLGVIWYANPLR